MDGAGIEKLTDGSKVTFIASADSGGFADFILSTRRYTGGDAPIFCRCRFSQFP
jgi:hypothetical protein